MINLKLTIFAILGGVHRCGGQAFFDKCLSICNRMTASSYVPPAEDKKLAALKSKPPLERAFGHEESACPATVFSFLPLGRSFTLEI